MFFKKMKTLSQNKNLKKYSKNQWKNSFQDIILILIFFLKLKKVLYTPL